MQVSGQTKIYRKDFNGRPAYSRRISAQEYKNGQKGNWINVYENVQMPKDTNIPDGCIIEVVKGFESLYNSKNGIMRKLIVTEYKVLDQPRKSVRNENTASEDYNNNAEPDNMEGFTQLQDDEIPF